MLTILLVCPNSQYLFLIYYFFFYNWCQSFDGMWFMFLIAFSLIGVQIQTFSLFADLQLFLFLRHLFSVFNFFQIRLSRFFVSILNKLILSFAVFIFISLFFFFYSKYLCQQMQTWLNFAWRYSQRLWTSAKTTATTVE